MNIRDEIITGTFAIGADGKKEPIDWKDYALKLEDRLSSLPAEDKAREEAIKELDYWKKRCEAAEKLLDCVDNNINKRFVGYTEWQQLKSKQ